MQLTFHPRADIAPVGRPFHYDIKVAARLWRHNIYMESHMPLHLAKGRLEYHIANKMFESKHPCLNLTAQDIFCSAYWPGFFNENQVPNYLNWGKNCFVGPPGKVTCKRWRCRYPGCSWWLWRRGSDGCYVCPGKMHIINIMVGVISQTGDADSSMVSWVTMSTREKRQSPIFSGLKHVIAKVKVFEDVKVTK